MRLLTTTLGIAALSLSACNAGDAITSPDADQAAVPAALESQDGSWLAFESGLRVVLEGDRVVLYSEEAGAEMGAGETLALAQAVVYAGMDAAQETKTGTKAPWPPDRCRTSDDPKDDAPAEGEEAGEPAPEDLSYVAANDSTSGCPLRLESDPDTQAALADEAGAELFAVSSDEPQYALGYWHLDAEQYGEDRLAFANGVIVERVEDRVAVQLPEEAVVLSPAEALALGYAAAYAGSDAAVAIGGMPFPWPPPICDVPDGVGERGWAGCPVPFLPGPALWQALVPETGIPIAAGDPEAALVYTFGFWHRPQRW